MNLQRFCATPGDVREHLHKPWREGKWVYATNGHVCVRLSDPDCKVDAIPKPDKAPEPDALFTKYIDNRDGEFLVLPKLPNAQKCVECSGRGTHPAVKCPDCDDGEFTHGMHTYECKTCSPDKDGCEPGWLIAHTEVATHVRECYFCDGRGFQKASAELGGKYFELGYLNWLMRLPQLRVRTGDPDKTDEAAAFIFDGGQALLMPLRSHY